MVKVTMLGVFNRIKYPVINQYDQTDCGAACLLSILKYYKGNDNIVHIRELCNVDTNGARMFDIVNAAQKLGFDAFGAQGSYDDLIKEEMPCIAHVFIEEKLYHFIIVYKINQKKVLVSDPAKGLYWLKRDEFEKIWVNNSVIILNPEKDIYNQKQDSNLKWILKYLRKNNAWVIQSVFLGIIYSSIGLAISIFIRIILDKLIPENNISNLIITGVFLVTILSIKSLIGYFRRRFLTILNKKMMIDINTDFLTHIFNLPKKFFDRRKTGDITARINDLDIVQRTILLVINSSIIDFIMIAGALSLMFIFSKTIALITLIIIPIYSIILLANTNKVKLLQYDVMKNHATVESKYIDSFKGIDEIMGFSASKAFVDINKMLFAHYQESNQRLGFKSAGLNFLVEIFNSLITIVLLIIGAIHVVLGRLEIGQMMAAYSLFSYILPSIINLINAYISLQGAKMALRRLKDIFLVEREKIQQPTFKEKINRLSIQQGTFCWPKSETSLFNAITINLEKGKLTGLFGKSGIGKSTLTNIVQRKYALTSGKLLINDKRAEQYNIHQYRRKIGIVPQSIKIFNGTILENILIGRSVKDIQEVNRILEKYDFMEFINQYKGGLFTLIGEEERQLSGGEIQIIAFIRALFNEPDILLIDEGLSGIDIDIKARIIKILKDYAKDHIVLLISHNIPLMKHADYIYHLEKGRISQEGRPELIFNKIEEKINAV
ncbi:MAG: peptidase domain-containing ABC transporter [Fidelibacterota bacterium]